jgi:hypothetical protein
VKRKLAPNLAIFLCKRRESSLLNRGAEIRGMWEKTFSSHCLAWALGLCLVVAGSPALGAEQNFDGVYSGKRALTKG